MVWGGVGLVPCLLCTEAFCLGTVTVMEQRRFGVSHGQFWQYLGVFWGQCGLASNLGAAWGAPCAHTKAAAHSDGPFGTAGPALKLQVNCGWLIGLD